jgi:hypothetical protein
MKKINKKRFDRFVDIARRMKVKDHENLNYRHFCFVFKGKKALSIGYNSCKTHPKANSPFCTRHAEFHAGMRFINYYDSMRIYNDRALHGLDILVIRFDYQNNLRMSKPCPSCEEFLINHGVRNVFYS